MVIPVSIDIEKNKKGGGVSLHIQNGISFILRNDLDYFDSEMETVFIEIDKCIFNTGSKIVIGLIYPMSNSSVDVFNDHIADAMNVIQKERNCVIWWGIWMLTFWKLVTTEPQGNYLMYCIVIMYFPWSQNIQE